jgi:hypothetical protein
LFYKGKQVLVSLPAAAPKNDNLPAAAKAYFIKD